ncbi:MAG: hypothetical protein JWL73_491 [Actinomycetia bacterium]|nr:hypothetical protein [Actinomycetes bacterium]
MNAVPTGPATDPDPEALAWRDSGLLDLHAPRTRNQTVPAGALARLTRVGERIDLTARDFDCETTTDVVALLLARAQHVDARGSGQVSVGGSARLLRASDDWIAVNLARPDDVTLFPAWLGCAIPDDDPWPVLVAAVADRRATDVVATGQDLGVPVAVVGPSDDDALRERHPGSVHPWLVDGPAPDATPVREPLVVDFSSLWAGPLCARLLRAGCGARVMKVESTRRPDGARAGSPGFYAALHDGDETVTVDFGSADGRETLQALVARADVVIEGSRPRALTQLGLSPASGRAAHPGQVWTSITAYGRTGSWSNRVGFGDDTAAAGGLVAWTNGEPAFLGDAIADPITGALAALATLTALARGGGVTIDVALRDAACWTAGGRHPTRVRI